MNGVVILDLKMPLDQEIASRAITVTVLGGRTGGVRVVRSKLKKVRDDVLRWMSRGSQREIVDVRSSGTTPFPTPTPTG